MAADLLPARAPESIRLYPKMAQTPASKGKDDLTRRTARGVLWLFGKTGVVTVSKLIFLMVLARLLVPEEFGLVAMAAVISTLVTNIARLGVSPAIVQHPDLTLGHRIAGVHLGLVLGALAGLAVYFSAGPVARFVDMEGLAPLLQMIALIPLIASVGQVSEGMLQRELRFKELALISGSAQILSQGAIAIPLAVAGFGAEALIWGLIAFAAIKTLAEVMRSRPPLALSTSSQCYTDIMRFGTGVSMASVSQTVAYNVDNFVIGKFLGAEALGFYSRAFQVLTMPTKLFGMALSKVLFPAMAAVQHDKERLSRAFLHSIGVTAMVSLPATAFLIAAAPELVWLILGDQWGAVVVPFQLLALAILARVGNKICDSLVRATGAVYGLAWRQGLYAALVCGGAYFGHFHGLEGATVGVVLAIAVSFAIMLRFAMRLADTSQAAAIGILLRHFSVGGALGLILWAVTEAGREQELHPMAILSMNSALAAGFTLMIIRLYPRILGEEGRALNKVVRKLRKPKEMPQ